MCGSDCWLNAISLRPDLVPEYSSCLEHDIPAGGISSLTKWAFCLEQSSFHHSANNFLNVGFAWFGDLRCSLRHALLYRWHWLWHSSNLHQYFPRCVPNVTCKCSERSIKIVLDVTWKCSERSIKIVLDVTWKCSERTSRTKGVLDVTQDQRKLLVPLPTPDLQSVVSRAC